MSWKDCGPWRVHSGADFFPVGLQLKRRAHTGASKKCEEEGRAERSCYEMTTTCCFPSSYAAQRVGRRTWSEAGLRKGKRKGVILMIVFLFLIT